MQPQPFWLKPKWSKQQLSMPSVCKKPAGCKPVRGCSPLHGTMLGTFIRQHVDSLSIEDKKSVQAKFKKYPFSMSTACSGSGAAEVIYLGLCHELKIKPVLDFACEKSKSKRNFMHDFLHQSFDLSKLMTRAPCMFDDITTLGTGVGRCSVHEKHGTCPVPRRSSILVCGFSCKDLSTLNSNHGQRRATILSEGVGSSGSTFKGLLEHTELARPRMLLLENVLEMSKTESPNVLHLWSSFETLDYAGSSKTFVSTDYGIPQKRARQYFVLLDLQAHGCTAEQAVAKAEAMLTRAETFKKPPMPLAACLLKNSDPLVQAELARKKAACTGGESNSWVDMHKHTLKSKGLTYQDIVRPAAVMNSPWYDVLPPRERECLGLSIKLAKDKGIKLTTVDLSPRIDRTTEGRDGLVPTLTTSTKTGSCR